MKRTRGFTIAELVMFVIAIAGFGGWVANIVKIIGSNFDNPITTMLVVRLIGIFVAPLGAVIGYF